MPRVGEAAVLAKARRAADVVLRAFVAEDGSVRRREAAGSVRFLADAASFGRALVRLAAATGEARYRDVATKIAGAIERDFTDPNGGPAGASSSTSSVPSGGSSINTGSVPGGGSSINTGSVPGGGSSINSSINTGSGPNGALFDHTLDAAAAGVFARRERSFEPSLQAVRFFAALAHAANDAALLDRARRLLAAISTPRALDARGRMLGEYLLAADEAGFYPW